MKQAVAVLVAVMAVTAWAQSNERAAQATTGDAPRAAQPSDKMNEEDRALADAVRGSLTRIPELSGVQVSADNGVVTLEGAIPSRAERARARDVARSVAGVKRVRDRMTTAAAPPSTDASQNNAGSIVGSTAAKSGVKKGGASDASAGDSKTSAPSTNPGTRPDDVQPKQPAASTITPPNRSAIDPFADDPALLSRIETALRNDASLAGEVVNVTATPEAIQLSGNVSTGKTKVTALRIAQSYAGNRRVSDKITVTRPGRKSPTSATAPENAAEPKRNITPSVANSAVPR